MTSPASGKSPVAQAGWLFALLFVAWLAFLFVPAPKPAPEPTPAFVKPPPSRLVALGLPDNPDLDALPEIFALFVDKADWPNDRTVFAYWNHGSNSYSYFFEATRVNGTYHFRAIPEPHDDGLSIDRSDYSSPEDCPIRFYRFPILNRQLLDHPKQNPLKFPEAVIGGPGKVKLSEPAKTSPFEIKLPALELEQQKK